MVNAREEIEHIDPRFCGFFHHLPGLARAPVGHEQPEPVLLAVQVHQS